MAERTLPWWRKVIDYAISGIRSLLRPARQNAVESSEPADSHEEISVKQEFIPEQAPLEVEEYQPVAHHIVASFLRSHGPEQPEIESVEDIHATPADEKHVQQLEHHAEPAMVAEEHSEPVAEEVAAKEPVPDLPAAAEPAAVREELSDIEALGPAVESFRDEQSKEDQIVSEQLADEQIEEEHQEPVRVQEPTTSPSPIAVHESISEQAPSEIQEEPTGVEAPVLAIESELKEHLEEEHSEPAPIQEPTAEPVPIAEHKSIAEKESDAVPQLVADTEAEQVLIKEEAGEVAEPAESIHAGEKANEELVEEIPNSQPANPVQEDAKQEATDSEETEIVHIEAEAVEPIAAPEEPTAGTAPEPVAESLESPALETEAPGPQPEEEDPKHAAAPPAVAESAPSLATPSAPVKTEAEIKTAARIAAAVKTREESADPSPFSILVDQVYDGPLDLLLDLIRKQDIDIYDIPIAKITAQFLAYVNQLKASDVDVAGEFIYTASLLIHIKSKMLLPRAPGGPDDAAEDPRRELVERLLEHEKFKNAAQMLQQKQMLEAATWTNPGVREFKDDTEAEPEIAADTVDLVRIFQVILDRARNRPILNVEEDSVTVGQMIQFLTRRLTMEDKPVALSKLLSNTKSERALIAMFLALLELVRLQAILLRQDRHFTDIFIKKNSGFESAMEQSLANANDDWR